MVEVYRVRRGANLGEPYTEREDAILLKYYRKAGSVWAGAKEAKKELPHRSFHSRFCRLRRILAKTNEGHLENKGSKEARIRSVRAILLAKNRLGEMIPPTKAEKLEEAAREAGVHYSQALGEWGALRAAGKLMDAGQLLAHWMERAAAAEANVRELEAALEERDALISELCTALKLLQERNIELEHSYEEKLDAKLKEIQQLRTELVYAGERISATEAVLRAVADALHVSDHDTITGAEEITDRLNELAEYKKRYESMQLKAARLGKLLVKVANGAPLRLQ